MRSMWDKQVLSILLSILQQIDGILTVELSATLAGLTLVVLTFILTGPLNELKAKLQDLTLPPPLGKGLEEENEIVRRVRENAEKLEKSCKHLYHAFLFFIFSLILMLTIFDGPLAIYSEDIMVEMLDVILTGSALLIGISFLLRAMRTVSKYYFE
jgi:hypothetical protein